MARNWAAIPNPPALPPERLRGGLTSVAPFVQQSFLEMPTQTPSPQSSRRRMPAEWEPHAATWVFWPTGPALYLYGSSRDFAAVNEAFQQLVDVLCAFEPVRVAADPQSVAAATEFLGKRATIVPIPLDDSWARDAAPTFVAADSSMEAVCWKFTGWGGRFCPFGKDAQAAARIAECMDLRRVDARIGIEGGAIHSDGGGTVLTTDPVLSDPGRNPGLTRGEVEEVLRSTLGANRVVSLPVGYNGDDTGGHVDVVAAFSPGGAVFLNDCSDSEDPNAQGSIANRRALENAGCEVIAVPQPEARFSGDDRLAYSYLNFYVCNGAVLVPTFGDRNDNYAQGIFRENFPSREIISIDARPFYLGGGGIHCVTQQVPLHP